MTPRQDSAQQTSDPCQPSHNSQCTSKIPELGITSGIVYNIPYSSCSKVYICRTDWSSSQGPAGDTSAVAEHVTIAVMDKPSIAAS